MEYVKVAGASDIAPGTMKIVSLDGTDVLVSNVEGKFYAIANKCSHMGGSLGLGKLNGNVVTCPRHGSQFDVTTGKNLVGAKILFAKVKVADEPAYEVKVEGADILIKKQ